MDVICSNREAGIERQLEAGTVLDPIDQQIAEQVAGVLIKHYPGHDWLVQVDRRKGLIDIRNLSLDGAMGCRIPMDGPSSSSELDQIAMRYGGEILERFNLKRAGLDMDALCDLPVDFAGRLGYDR